MPLIKCVCVRLMIASAARFFICDLRGKSVRMIFTRLQIRGFYTQADELRYQCSFCDC